MRWPGGNATDYVSALVFAAVGVTLLIGAARQPDFGVSNQSPGVFPAVVGAITILASLSLAVETARRSADRRRADDKSVDGESPVNRDTDVPATSPGRFFGVVAAILAYVLLLRRVHFAPASFIFLVALMVVLKSGSVLRIIVISLCAVVAVQLVFGTAFRVVLP
ncbi:MAG: tripartite tricarboxylate transporter TctB family protein [Firmicutes bacterium]|jgi:hypothetical protein|nr:tripartite tricarboxylate transporter TctB family protein [Bacillota bacterium]MDH7496747.1 tripartite tricarboxylate transporter TctB family protein [Bacillota bacterium]